MEFASVNNENFCPVANEKSVVKGEKYRFTILTDRLVRIEYNENGVFEDRATQTVVNRKFDTPKFTVTEENGVLFITTERIRIEYTKEPFSRYSLKVKYMGKNSAVTAGHRSSYWFYGEEIKTNLKGTRKTLDFIDGECELEDGIMSKGEICVLDDSNTLCISEDGWIATRNENAIDKYLFCYGDADLRYDYKACLRDYYKLTGPSPLIPRYVLGNWWSRYYPYTQKEYTDLMNRFKAEDIPFSVSVIDMDWHLVKIDSKYGSGWTGYTWNEELFPDHCELLDFLHKNGLEVTLNLHPQEGVGAHEKMYEQMAHAMGINPESKECVPFDITNPKFLENYFKLLHHPLEDEGVTFWWIDWQQGNITSIPGLDPLWMLNHYHYLDNARRGNRPLIFSRYSGPGSHRYPIGFSGDTFVTWETLKFQPYFTATASNIGYSWWSHDIGGHMFGYSDNELSARWIQFGVFSPVNRLHSCPSEFLSKEPWRYDKITEASIKKFMKLRHELIPYIYSMNYRNYKYSEPLIQPLYYNWNTPEAFENETEYTFGNQMLVSPVVSPNSKTVRLGEAKVYLPKGDWYDFFTNDRYKGARTLSVFRNIEEMPVFVKSGGIVPMAVLENVNDTANPKTLRVKIFAGASGHFELYEDDGKTQAFKDGAFAITNMSLHWQNKPVFEISKPCGDTSVTHGTRNFELEFIGIEENTDITVYVGKKEHTYKAEYVNGVLKVSIRDASDDLRVEFNSEVTLKKNDIVNKALSVLSGARLEIEEKDRLFNIIKKNTSKTTILAELINAEPDRDTLLALCEIITADTN